jgi:three-Cys-motif partner protein
LAIIDREDGLPLDVVGPWAGEKHEQLRRYIAISRGARRRFLPPGGSGGASYIDLYCSWGKSVIRDTSTVIDGSPLVAFKAAKGSDSAFSEIHLADMAAERCEAAVTRIRDLGGSAKGYTGSAQETVKAVLYALNPFGLHFAFLDPYNLQALPFSVIETLAQLKRIDILIHVSAQDLQRNLHLYTAQDDERLNIFMPGWRERVDIRQSQPALRAQLFDYWLGKIKNLGMMPARGVQLITGGKNQRLYWLVFISQSEFANRLWDEIGNPHRLV